MGSHTILILCIALSAAQIVLGGETWEFGSAKIPGSVLVAHNEGYMGLFEHTKKINLSVPQCYEMTYVKVQVKNLISTPKVQYNPKTNVVTIAYNLLQSSLSSYDVVGKAAWKRGCKVLPPPPNYG